MAPYSLLLLALAVYSASAAVVPRQSTPCTFSITAIGATNSRTEEDTIGEIRIGGNYPQSSYIITGHTLTDAQSHSCLIYPPTAQFGCFQGLSGTTNFSLADDGNLLHDGSSKWLACPASSSGGDGSSYLYSDAKADTTGCQTVTLLSGGFSCAALGSPTLEAPPSPSSTSASAACPTDINSGTFQFPHLIVPTSPTSPNYAFGNSYSAHISAVNTTLFNFDIPDASPYLGTCALLFLFPYASSLDSTAGTYTFSGIEEENGEHGGLDFALLAGVASSDTTYNTTPGVSMAYGTTEILPGNAYTIAKFPCQSGARITYQVSSKGNVELDYFQDSKESAIGLYIVPCS